MIPLSEDLMGPNAVPSVSYEKVAPIFLYKKNGIHIYVKINFITFKPLIDCELEKLSFLFFIFFIKLMNNKIKKQLSK